MIRQFEVDEGDGTVFNPRHPKGLRNYHGVIYSRDRSVCFAGENQEDASQILSRKRDLPP